jgi:anti-sigma28 factor (negative regulator of flagellin synthesis)
MSSSGHDDSSGDAKQRGRGEDAEAAGMDPKARSSRDQDIQRAKQIVERTPEIRMDRVAAVKRALLAGTLNLRGVDLAEKLLQDILYYVEPEA